MLLLLWLSIGARATDFHVTPDAKNGDGSQSRPWDLPTALSHPPLVKHGDTIYLHAGTYRGAFLSNLKGTSDAPITVRPFANDRVTIDCLSPKPNEDAQFTIQGQWTIYRDFEVTCSNTKRRTQNTGSFPSDIHRGGITCSGSQIKLINLIVHDCANGLGFWSSGEGGEIYGCIIYNNGWGAPDRGHGHGIYTQNKTGTKRLADNVIFNQFSHGIHAYGSFRAFLSGFDIEGNICFNNGLPGSGPAPDILVGGGCPVSRLKLLDNFTYESKPAVSVRLGYGANNEDAILKNNYICGGLSISKWKSLEANGNSFFGNISIEGSPAIDRSKLVQFKPTGTRIVVRPNQYEPGRANIFVYNWDRKDRVSVDLAAVLKPGTAYRIINAQNPLGEAVIKGVYQGQSIELPMTPTTTARPVGMPEFRPPATEPEFGVFVLTTKNKE